MRFKDKVVLISGAGSIRAGMGNGKATAIAFAGEGAKVVAVDKNLAAAQETIRIIRENGGKGIALQADVAREEEARKVIEFTITEYGMLNILFNNVGIGDSRAGLKVTETEWDLVMGVNLKSVLFMCKYAAPEMRKVGGGAIVNNASMAAFYGHPIFAYSASKAGVVALTRSLAVSLAKDNIRVNCVSPGFIDTPMVAPVMNERRIKNIELRVPMKRHGKAEEVAGTVLFLASDDASYITGQTISVDGGMSIY
ncbi:MAG: SDR family NAD(P)-dependent oxidoreductase [Dehalococcoidia bacterium]|jgi:NAD(P)-dependent dehydrogenase (short-subunit alcohol dehydrogenase family)